MSAATGCAYRLLQGSSYPFISTHHDTLIRRRAWLSLLVGIKANFVDVLLRLILLLKKGLMQLVQSRLMLGNQMFTLLKGSCIASLKVNGAGLTSGPNNHIIEAYKTMV